MRQLIAEAFQAAEARIDHRLEALEDRVVNSLATALNNFEKRTDDRVQELEKHLNLGTQLLSLGVT